MPPAMEAILSSPSNQVQAFLAAGHVCAVMGWQEYEPIAARYGVPIVVTGFEPLDLLEGILMAIRQLEEGRAEVENQYARAVRREGNQLAQETVFRVFEVGDRTWRGIGMIPASGYHLKPAFAAFDAEERFQVADIETREHPACIAGDDPPGYEDAARLHGLRRPAARRGGRWARRWSRARGPARHTTPPGAGSARSRDR